MQRPDLVYDDTSTLGVFDITLHTGERVALQLSIEQFGCHHLHKPVMRWDKYWEEFSRGLIERNRVGVAEDINYQLILGLDNERVFSFFTATIIGSQFSKCLRKEFPLEPGLPSGPLTDYASDVLDYIIQCWDVGLPFGHPPSQTRNRRYGGKGFYFYGGRETISVDYGPILENFGYGIIYELANDEEIEPADRENAVLILRQGLTTHSHDHRICFNPVPPLQGRD
jgi:hypothetical protein